MKKYFFRRHLFRNTSFSFRV